MHQKEFLLHTCLNLIKSILSVNKYAKTNLVLSILNFNNAKYKFWKSPKKAIFLEQINLQNNWLTKSSLNGDINFIDLFEFNSFDLLNLWKRIIAIYFLFLELKV